MIKNVVILGLLIINNTIFGQITNDFNKFYLILGKLESNNNKNAIGDNGKAIGIYQIHEHYFNDARDFDKNLSKLAYNDCFNPEISKLVVRSYISRYCKNGSMEDMARCHNSGPNWKNKINKTNNYIKRFRLAIRNS